jgi:UDP-hydrolysing UDP-N-acetyl-D-glucosamine 2-epimerase
MLRDDRDMRLALLVGGMHCAARFGDGVAQIRAEGFAPDEVLPWWREGQSVHEEAGAALAAVGCALPRVGASALLLVGDRYETAAAALAATLARVPVVHLHGGEETEGAFDNALRHAITKLASLHLVSHADYRRRVIAMGEDPSTIHEVGAPGLDNLHRTDLPDRAELARSLGLQLSSPIVLVTVHPATLATDPTADVDAVIAAMNAVDATYVVTLPNADPGNEDIRARLVDAVRGHPRRVAVEALGERRYWAFLRIADAMLGNSSSALIEAPVVGLPAVNVGDRQKGRLRPASVLDARPESAQVIEALRLALSTEFRASARAAPSPFGDGRSAARIAAVLRAWTPPSPPRKRGVHGQ